MRGIFIAIEGIEGTGKSTQVQLLADRLKRLGHDTVVVREPGGTPLAEAARQVVLHDPLDITPASELFLYQAARADLVARVIGPALQAGRIVLADRFELSTLAYQSAGRGLPLEAVKHAIALAVGDVRPDLYLVLDVSIGEGRARQASQGKSADRIESAGDAFHERVAAAYAAANAPDVEHVPSVGTPEQTHQAVWAVVARRFPVLGRKP